ncbi:MAG: VIT1/CCC1 transporter family protein [Candidatus Micrarchaeota archaeon]|nr:VIT1/CCC1 transporter family protein [Candidatus Micrarchaeota archaeon]
MSWMESEERAYLRKIAETEMLHTEIYRALADSERDRGMKDLLAKFSAMEHEHSNLWAKAHGAPIERRRYLSPFMGSAVIAFRKVFGVALTAKFIEYNEAQLHAKLEALIKRLGPRDKDAALVHRLMAYETSKEAPLERRIIGYSPILNNIRDVIFGMNDGLVEVLAATVGFAAAVQSASIVLLAGFIVAISGTLSMSGGAYLSTEYEASLAGSEKETARAKRSAYYVGLLYLVGAFFPLLPFIFGYTGAVGIVLSIISTSIVLAVASSLISIISGTSIKTRVVKSLLISLGAAAVTILLGYFARTTLHISI